MDADTDLVAAISSLIGHTGATGFQVRYSDDVRPVVWLCVAIYDDRFEVSAGATPGKAAWRLAESLIDGGQCTVCGRPSALIEGEERFSTSLGLGGAIIEAQLGTLCEYRYRASNIVRGCDSMPVGTRT